MATYSAAKSLGVKTLTAATVDTVTLTYGFKFVEVKNWGTDRISFRVDGTNPTVDGNECYIVGGGEGLNVPSLSDPDLVKLISAGTPSYSITGSN